MINDSVLPNFTLLTTSKFENFIISSDEIVSLIRNLNKGKANGPDDVSAHMLILCDETIAIPLNFFYEQVLAIGIFPNIWKSANLTPIHKKVTNNLSKIIALFHCYQYVVKCLRKLYLTSYTCFLLLII